MKFLIFISVFIIGFAAQAKTGESIYKKKCMGCHGTNETMPRVPTLFGQEPAYIRLQLMAFKSDNRQDSNMHIMNAVAKKLSEDDMKKVASYLAGKEPCEITMTVNTEAPQFMEKFKAGRELVKNNNCMHCHGSFHHAAPRLHGQKYEYLKFTLEEFKSGSRKNRFMDRILPILDEESTENISVYFNAQRVMRECRI